jgi:hypothetical protein
VRPLRLVEALPPETPEPPALHGRAAADLRFIRETMERSAAFTAVPGKGAVVMGALGCAGSFAASQQATAAAWLGVWALTAAAAVSVGGIALWRKASAAGTPISRGIGARFVGGLGPPLVAGAALTLALWRAGATGAMPAAWLALYGTGLLAAGLFSERIVRVLGASFLALGALAAAAPSSLGDLLMALGFGGLHVGFGIAIWRRYGG